LTFRLWHGPDQQRCALNFRSWAKKATSHPAPRSYQLKDQELHPLSTTLFISA